MNIIKYLRWKDVCPECGSKLYKDMNNEIACIKCGLLVLDYYPNKRKYIDNALELGRRQWFKRRRKKKKIK